MTVLIITLIAWVIVTLLIYVENDNIFLSLPTIIFLGICYFFFRNQINYKEYLTFQNIGSYFFIGFINSVVMTFVKSKQLNSYDKKYFNLKTAVFNWIFYWPFTITFHLISDLIKEVYNFIYSKISFLYLGIFNHGSKDENN